MATSGTPNALATCPCVALPCTIELTGEKSEAGQIVFGMGKDRQVAIEINHLLAFDPTSKRTIDLHTACRKNGKLHLRHPFCLPPLRPGLKTENPQLGLIFVPPPA